MPGDGSGTLTTTLTGGGESAPPTERQLRERKLLDRLLALAASLDDSDIEPAYRPFNDHGVVLSVEGLALLLDKLPRTVAWSNFLLYVLGQDFGPRRPEADAALELAPTLAERLVTVYSTKAAGDEEKLIFGLRGERGNALRNISQDSLPKVLKKALKTALNDARVGYYERYTARVMTRCQLMW